MIAIPAPPIVSAGIGLRLLRPELNRAVLLEALATRPMSVSNLCAQLMLESDTTLREQLDHLAGAGAIEKRAVGQTSAGEFRLTANGVDLIDVMTLIGAWLTARPGRPLSPESDAAWRAFAALADGWEATLLQHLLLQPSTKAELQKKVPLSKEKLKRMLRRLYGAGLLKPLDGEGRSPRYAPTVWARRAIAVLVAIAQWERVHLHTAAEPVAACEGAIALLASLPLIRVPTAASGICVLTVEAEPGAPSPRASAVWARLTDGRVTACRSGSPPSLPDAWIHGGVKAWLEAVIKDRPRALHLGGDQSLVRPVLHGLYDEQFRASGRLRLTAPPKGTIL